MSIGRVYFNQGRYQEALAIEKKALYLMPDTDSGATRYDIYTTGKNNLVLGNSLQALDAVQTGLTLALEVDDRVHITEGYELSSRINAIVE